MSNFKIEFNSKKCGNNVKDSFKFRVHLWSSFCVDQLFLSQHKYGTDCVLNRIEDC
jgi:hypothetical protein